MANNTLTNLEVDIHIALDTVSREMHGFIPAVQRDSRLDRAAMGQTVRSARTSQGSTADNTAAVTPPDTGEETVANETISITKSKHYPVKFTGEETLGLSNTGIYNTIKQDRFAQAFRTLTNEIETDLAGLYTYASRAYGTAGTTPFPTADDLTHFTGVKQILDENGAPSGDRHLVLGHAAINNLMGKQSGLFHVNEANAEDILRQGMTRLPLLGMQVWTTGQVATHTKGTMTGADPDGAEVVGATSITSAGSDSGTVLTGDVGTWSGDSNRYVISNATQTISGGATGDMIINRPGLQESLSAGTEWTTGSSYTANLAFHRNAIFLATRLPAMPEKGDLATETTTVTDPLTGLSFEIRMYPGFHQTTFHVTIAWGFAAIKPEHIAILLG